MVPLISVRTLIRRLATALALLAMLVLGLHEVAHAAGSFAEGGQPPMVAGQMHLQAVPDHDKTGGDSGKHHGAIPHSCHVCGTVMPSQLAREALAAPATIFPAPDLAPEQHGLDPGGPRRPPRAPVIT